MENLNNWEEKFEFCVYSRGLIDKITNLNNIAKFPPVNIKEVKKAIYYAKKYHGRQIRDSGEPYYSHPLEVASLISDYLFRTDIIVTSILHDTIEDTVLTKEIIGQLFGAKVANQVEDLTRVKPYGKISSAEMIEILYKEKKYEILLIKWFDRFHNMQTLPAKAPEKIKKIVEETLSQFISLSIYFRARIPRMYELENKLNNLCLQNVFKHKLDITNKVFLENKYCLPPLSSHNTPNQELL